MSFRAPGSSLDVCLALGETLPAAVAKAKRFVTAAIKSGPNLGQGISPVNFLTPPE
jgi:hydroxymethylpyrimidine/phosphomethylpyrimidine kinase